MTQKVCALGACHLVLADECPFLQEAFPDCPLSLACFSMASRAPLAHCCLLDWPSLCLQNKMTDSPDTGVPNSWF